MFCCTVVDGSIILANHLHFAIKPIIYVKVRPSRKMSSSKPGRPVLMTFAEVEPLIEIFGKKKRRKFISFFHTWPFRLLIKEKDQQVTCCNTFLQKYYLDLCAVICFGNRMLTVALLHLSLALPPQWSSIRIWETIKNTVTHKMYKFIVGIFERFNVPLFISNELPKMLI